MAVIYGTTGPDTRNGTPENDTIYGWIAGGNSDSVSGDDELYGQAGNDKLHGGTGNDILDGGTGNDYISGGGGGDKFYGGTGDDTFVVGSGSDIITEKLNEGIDKVKAYVGWTLVKNLENLTLQGSSDINGTGNVLDNIIVGNIANNGLFGFFGDDTLRGGSGNDSLKGWEGTDVLYGEAGDDTLQGRLVGIGHVGAKRLYGGQGKDTYYVESTGDSITEYLNEGIDTVVVYGTSWVLGDNLENLESTTGFGTESGTGNSLNNKIAGGGADSILNGGIGNDTLSGGEGRDTLTGGNGGDHFVFNTLDQGIDTITDFSVSVAGETINVSAAGFGGGLTAGAAIIPEQFVLGTATDANNRFIYDKSTGALFFDVDGMGGTGQVQFATLSTNLAMTNADIFVIT